MTKEWNPPRAEHNQQILDEAAEWFVDVREGDLDAAAQQEFAGWLRRSPDHIKAYLEVAAFWADVPQLASKEQIDIDALVAYARTDDNVIPLGERAAQSIAERQRTEPSPSVAARRRPSSMSRRIAVAATVSTLVVGLASAVWLWGSRGQTYVTAIGEQRSVTLADGSTIDMNARSRIRIRFSDRARDVELLQGQALFTVAGDPQRPFTVSSDDTRVRAVGTQFMVYRRKSGTTVTVLEGKVSVMAGAESVTAVSESQPRQPAAAERQAGSAAPRLPILVTAGEELMMDARYATPKPADVASATAWTQRQIVFQGTPLTEVVEEFNRYNLRQMVILDPDLESVHVSGIFSSTQSASLLRFLREQVGLVVSERDDAVEISRH